MRKLMRKRILVPVAAIAALALAGIAFAYFTSSGTGSGTGTVGSDAGVTLDNVSIDSTLYPGNSSNVRFTITNTSSSTAVQVGKVVADTSTYTNGISGLPDGCDPAWFSFGDVTVNASIAASGTLDKNGTLSFRDSGTSQDACKSATPTLHLKVDNSGI